MQLVTDPDILAQLNSDEGVDAPEPQPVTDPDLLNLLNSDEEETPPPATDWKTGMVTPQRLPELGTPSNYMKNSVAALTGSRSNTEIPVTEEALKSAESAVEENRPQVPMGGVGSQLPEEENKARLAEELKQLRLKYAKQEEIASRGPLDTLAHGAGGLETYLEGVKEELKATKDPVSILTREAGKGLEGADYLARKAINELTPELVAPKPEENSILGQMKRDPANKMMDEAFAKGEKAAIEKGVPQAETLVEKGLSMAPAFLTPGGAAKGLGMLEKGGTALAKEGVSLGKDLGKIAKETDITGSIINPIKETASDIKQLSTNIKSKFTTPELELNVKAPTDTTPLTTPESQQAWSKTVTDRYKLVDDVINGSIPKEIAQTELNKIPDNVDELSAADKKIISLQNGALNHLDDPDALKVLLGDVDNTITQQQVEKMIKPFLYESKTMRYATNFRTNLINSYNTIMKDQLTKAKSQFIDPVTGKLDKKKLKEFTGEQDILQRLAVSKLEAFDEGINRYIGSKVHGDADGFAQVLAKDPETGDMIYKTSDMRAFDPIINDLRNNNINQADFDRYLLARDAVDQFTKDPKLDGYSGFRTMDEALAEVSKWETNPVAVKAAEDLHKLAKSNLDDMVIGGRLSRNEADQILAAHPNYVGVMLKRPNWLTPEIEEALGIKISAPSTRNTVKERTGKFKEERHSALGSIRNGLVNQSREAANNAVVASTFLESIRKLSPELRGVLYPGYEDSKLQELLSHYRLSRAEEDVIKTEILNTLPASTEEYLNRIQQSSLPDKAKEVLINKVDGVQKIVQRNLEDAAKEADVSKKYAVANFFDKNGNPIKGQTIPDDILKTMTDELQGYISGLEKDFDVDLKEVPDVGLSFYINGNKLDVNTASPYMAEMLRRNKPTYGNLKGVKDVSRFASRNLTSGLNALRIFLKEGADLPMFGAKGVTIYPYENVVTLMKMLRNKDPLISKYKKEFHETYGLSHQGRMSDLQTEYAPIKDIDDQIKSNTYGQRSTAGKAWDFSMKSLDMWDNAFDTATRLTIYKKAREAGYTRSEATIMANKTGVDFSQKGLDAKSVNAIKLFPFLYTSIKTGDRMLSLAMNNPARFSSAVMQGWAVSEVIDMWNNQFFDEDGKPIMANLPESRRMGHNYVLLPGAKSFNDSIDLYSGFVVGNQKEWVNKALKLTNQYVSDRLPSAIEESIVDMAPAFKEEGIENADQIIAAYKTIAEKNKVTFPDLLKTFVLAQMNTFALPTQAPVVSGVMGAVLGIDPITGKPFTDVGGAPAEAEQAYNPLQVPPYFLALREDLGLKNILPGDSPKAEWFILSNTFYNGLIKTVAEATAVPLGEMAGLYTMPEGSFAQNLPIVSPLGKLGEYTREREMASDAMARVNAIVFQHQALQKNHRNDPNDLDKLTALDTFEKEFGPILANAPVFDSLRADLKGIDVDQKNVMKDKNLSPSDKRDVIKSTEKRKAYAAKQINLLYTSGGFMSDEDIDLLDEGKIKFGPIIQPMIEKSKLKSRGVE